jgi:hypothetical protein
LGWLALAIDIENRIASDLYNETFRQSQLKDESPEIYRSNLQNELMEILDQEKAVYRPEIRYRTEALGYLPLDANYILKKYILENNVPIRSRTVASYQFIGLESTSASLFEATIERKLDTLRKRDWYLRTQGESLVDFIETVARACGLRILGRNIRIDNTPNSRHEADLLVELNSESGTFYIGFECKNWAKIVEKGHFTSELRAPIQLMKNQSIIPVVVARLYYLTTLDLIKNEGAYPIATQKLYLSPELYDIYGIQLKEDLGHYFIEPLPEHPPSKVVEQLEFLLENLTGTVS